MSASRPVSARPDATLLHPHHHVLLLTLARHGRFAAAATLFSTAHRTTGALNSLLASLCSSPSRAFLRIAPAVLLHAAPHAAPDAATFRILTSALCRRARRPSAAADLLRCMPALLLDPDPRSCRAVLASLCRRAPARDALAFLDDMRRWGVPPCRPDHGAVVDALLREGLAAEAYEVVSKQMDADGVAPALPDFERLLVAFRAAGSFDAVDEAFDEMLLRGLVPGVRVYALYVGTLCDRGDLDGARRMLGCMERAGCAPDAGAFGAVAAGCVAAGDVGAAREVARDAVRRGLRWDAAALAELVGALRAPGHLARAWPLLADIRRDGCAAGLDAPAFEQIVGEWGASCLDPDDEEGLCTVDGARRSVGEAVAPDPPECR